MDESAEPPRQPAPGPAGVDRMEALERQVRQLTNRLASWVEAQLVQALEDRRRDMEALRAELQTAVGEQLSERLETLAERAAEAAAGAKDQGRVGRQTSGIEELEQRARAAMSRLNDSVDSRLAESATTRQAELHRLRSELLKALARQSTELREEIAAATTSLHAMARRMEERLEGVEERGRQAADRPGQIAEAKLAEVVGGRRGELDEVKSELQEALAKGLSEARSEIGTSVADAHQRFAVAVHELSQRTSAVGEQVAAVARSLETLDEAVASDGRRLDALELHTRRTDARLTELVESKLAEVDARRSADLDHMRAELQKALRGQGRRVDALEAHGRGADARVADLVEGKLSELAGQRSVELGELRGELGTALDTHLGEVRAEVASAVGKGRTEIAAEAVALEERRAALDRWAGDAAAVLDGLGASLEAGLREAEERLGERIQAKLGELEALAGQVAEARAEMASLERKTARAQERLRRTIRTLAQQVDALAAGIARAAATESGALAPLRSDLRRLQGEVAELEAVVAELPPRRKAKATSGAKAAPPPRKAVPAAKAAKGAKGAKAVKTARAAKPVRRRETQ